MNTEKGKYELALVMPVYNEEECVGDVIDSWYDELTKLKIDFLMIILNDGSTDGTKDVLEKYAGNRRIEIVNKENSGHGPTILTGYRMSVKQAQWIFQSDSDNEIKAEHFSSLWNRRDEYDALFGIRTNRVQNPARKIISSFSRLTVRLLFGSGVTDVNVPFRLIRSDLLNQIVEHIADDAFAPNIIISGVLAMSGSRIFNHQVPHLCRRTGTETKMKWKVAFKAFSQTLYYRLVIKKL